MTFEPDDVAVITGAASGIGAGLARAARRRGMRVVIADIDDAALARVAAELGEGALAVPTNVADPDAVDRLAARAYEAFGQVDLLFNNAGVMATGKSWEIDLDRWRRSVDVNIMGLVHGARSFVPRMIAAGRQAHIVNTASVGGFAASPLMAPYSATKFAAVALTEALHGELRLAGAPIGVSLLAPGPVQSGIFDDPFGGAADGQAEAFVGTMRNLLDSQGLSPDAFADRVFVALEAGQFWIFPQPEALDPLIAARHAMLVERRDPALAAIDISVEKG